MLSRYINRSLSLTLKRRANISSDHHEDYHDHHHIDYSVTIDKNNPWIKYRGDKKLICFNGVEDVNYKLQPFIDTDPFHHIRTNPLFSFERLVFNDPWYHQDSHEIYNSTPERGYANGQDPLQTRFIYAGPIYSSIAIASLIFFLISLSDLRLGNTQGNLYNEKQARQYVIDSLQKQNKILKNLKEKQTELLKDTRI